MTRRPVKPIAECGVYVDPKKFRRKWYEDPVIDAVVIAFVLIPLVPVYYVYQKISSLFKEF